MISQMTTQRGETCEAFLSQTLQCYVRVQISTVSLRVIPLFMCQCQHAHFAGSSPGVMQMILWKPNVFTIYRNSGNMNRVALELSPKERDVFEYRLLSSQGCDWMPY
jgi:hypothetical protein